MLPSPKSMFLPQVAWRSSSCLAVAHGGSPTRTACHPVKGNCMEPKSKAECVPCLRRRHHREIAAFVVVEFSLLLEKGPVKDPEFPTPVRRPSVRIPGSLFLVTPRTAVGGFLGQTHLAQSWFAELWPTTFPSIRIHTGPFSMKNPMLRSAPLLGSFILSFPKSIHVF